MLAKNAFEEERVKFCPPLPLGLQKIKAVEVVEGKSTTSKRDKDKLKSLFPKTFGRSILHFKEGRVNTTAPLRVGVVFSGGQAPGGHNVVIGLFDALKKWHSHSSLIGFLEGPLGLIHGQYEELEEGDLYSYRNTGGFDLIGSGRTKIESPEQLLATCNHVESLQLDGLVIIGGDDSNTNTAILAEYFLSKGCRAQVVGIPKTIDGDLKSEEVEISFGFDTACKIYSEMIGNIARDALSAKKYYHFVKLMGRSASHTTLECALQTHPNLALIGEEVAERKRTLEQVVGEIVDLVIARSTEGKNYGVVLIPEGLIAFISEINDLIGELNTVLAKGGEQEALLQLSKQGRKTFSSLPEEIGKQLLLERDPHGNIQLSHIATEKLFIQMVASALKKRTDFKGKFTPVSHFFGYEGRSGFPSNFDATYCYALGHAALVLIGSGYTGYMATLKGLAGRPEEWEAGGIPITMMMRLEERKGREKAVIQKALVDLQGEPFHTFSSHRKKWSMEDRYRFPGPMQFEGPPHLCNATTYTLQLKDKVRV